ncbi:HNH endonuclease signature motif containing protein [Allokutzneria sp. NRRL B-24872]|uniref:HNH endonuclease signature motif containing protein n=1 Tax=Allokutzneria sp. NRRL B-24872 TaxID=1137961 RepID=UPI000A3C6904|nr:HNH endonuclease signature motif containing protein [Allokutzneria sp. NRRL B-24872]
MPLDDSDEKVKAAFAGVGRAAGELAIALTGFVDGLTAHEREYAEDLLLPLLPITRMNARRLLDNASSLAERPGVLAALVDGRIDERKALMIVDQLRLLTEVQAVVAEGVLIEHAARSNYTVTRQFAVRHVHRLDPKAAERRHKERRDARLVEKVALEDGMSLLRLTMTALDAAMAFDHVDRIARALDKDERTLDQKRADVAKDLLLGRDTDAPQGRVCVYLTMPMASFLGMSEEPAQLRGYGPLPAPVARDVAVNGIWKRVLTDPATGTAEDITTYRPSARQRELVQLRYPTCTMIGCNQPAHRCDVDHCCPFDGMNTTVANLRPKCRRHHRMKTHTDWSCANLPDGTHTWTTPDGKHYPSAPEPIADPAPF